MWGHTPAIADHGAQMQVHATPGMSFKGQMASEECLTVETPHQALVDGAAERNGQANAQDP
jgi:hypothetical protein